MKVSYSVSFLTLMAVSLITEGSMETSFLRDGDAHTYSCRKSLSSDVYIIWTLKMSRRMETIVACSFYNFRSYCSNNFPADFSVTFMRDNGGYVSNLTIHSHNDSMIRLDCQDFEGYLTTWTISIFSMPSKIACKTPYVEDDFIKVMCEDDGKASQTPICDFRYEPSEPRLNKTVTFAPSRRSTGLCILVARPISRSSFPKTEYRFSVDMIPSIPDVEKRNSSIVRSEWSPPITVEVLTLTANGQRGSVVVHEGENVWFNCTAISDQSHMLRLLNTSGLIKTQYGKTLTYQYSNGYYQHFSVLELSCQTENTNSGYAILGDSIKVYLITPLRLRYSHRNGTRYFASMSSLHYEITGYPAPMRNLTKLLSAGMYDSATWHDNSDFIISLSQSPVSYSYQLTLIPSESYRLRYLHSPDTKYMIVISNGLDPALWIFFIIWQKSSTDNTTFPWELFSTTSKTPDSFQSSETSPALWSLGLVFGVLVVLAIVLFIIIYSCRTRRARARERERQSGAAERCSSSALTASGAPLTSLARLAHRDSSNGSFPRDQQPSSRSVTSATDQRGVRHGDAQQLNAPPPYELVTLTQSNMNYGGMDTNAQLEPQPISQQDATLPPPYDSVSKFEEPPPPYPDDYM